MKLTVLAQQTFILKTLSEHIAELANQEAPRYSPTIEDGLIELVQALMRQIAQEAYYPGGLINLLDTAIAQAEHTLKDTLDDSYNLDLRPYFDHVYESLKFVSKEMETLQENLRKAKNHKKACEKWEIHNVSQPFEIREIGLHGVVEGFIASPLGAEGSIKIDEVQQWYNIEGDWFPLQVAIGEFIFVVDDDGTIFVSTEHLPARMVEDAREAIEGLGRRLYEFKINPET